MPEPQHKIRILSAATESYFPLRDVTFPTKVAYAKRWGHSYVHEIHNPIGEPGSRFPWDRVDHWRSGLLGSGWLLFSACDVAITNKNVDITGLIDNLSDLIVSSDGNGLNCDSFLMRECEASFQFLDNVLWMEGKVAHEQDAMVHAMSACGPSERNQIKTFQDSSQPRPGWYPTEELLAIAREEWNRTPLRVKIVPQRQLNAYPMKCYGGSGDEWWSWRPTDFCCHVVAKPLEFRIAAFKEMLRDC